MKILLLSTYEIGRQPFGLASPAAWLRRTGFMVTCADLAVQQVPEHILRGADVIAFYVPMHTATRLAIRFLRHIRQWNPPAHICFYGLYAPLNEEFLRRQGVDTVLGGEFEEGLVNLCWRLQRERQLDVNLPQREAVVSLNRQQFLVPDRNDLPDLSHYARLYGNHVSPKIVGYVEASRGCKHHCRHCPIVPVYQGRFRIVQREVVLEDIRQQVEAGAQHITFGDPDFFNGIGHALPIVRALHEAFPNITYDVTIKIEHLLKHDQHLPTLKDTGCLIVTSAVESLDDHVLKILNKGHTRDDFLRVVEILQKMDLTLNPTFVAFTPWTTLEAYQDMLYTLNELDLVENVSPVQYAIRLLLPEGSELLKVPQMRPYLGAFDEAKLSYAWYHPDPRMDALQSELMELISRRIERGASRQEIFREVWARTMQLSDRPLLSPASLRSRAPVPHLSEPWYC